MKRRPRICNKFLPKEVFPECPTACKGPIDVSCFIHNYTLLRAIFMWVIKEESNHPVVDACNSHAFGVPRTIIGSSRRSSILRLGVGDVQHVIVINKQSAGPSKLFPFDNKITVLVKNLDPIIASITDKKPPGRIHG